MGQLTERHVTQETLEASSTSDPTLVVELTRVGVHRPWSVVLAIVYCLCIVLGVLVFTMGIRPYFEARVRDAETRYAAELSEIDLSPQVYAGFLVGMNSLVLIVSLGAAILNSANTIPQSGGSHCVQISTGWL